MKKPKLIGDIGNKLSNFNKNIIIYVDKCGIDLNDYNHNDYELKIYWQIEPKGIIQRGNTNISFPILNKENFDLILAHDPEILLNCKNSILFPFGDCWIPDEDQKIYKKTKLISIIVSHKKYLTGHRLRHDVMSLVGDKVDKFGRSCNYVENKADAIKDYMFSICIENLRIENFFTEKLIDCLRTGTIPIYWGCPNIGNFFDVRGFIIVENIEQIMNAVNNLSEKDYISKLEYIEYNYNIAKNYGNNVYERVDNEITKLLKKIN